ncbi:MAG: hypothetical protein ACD_56C00031G0004 [uncultured bacterium]|nr:MAG: hypothetical protein ACD_56C00031G0004 [uncultured bacterium]
MSKQKLQHMNQSQVATLLSEVYSGVFMMPRAVTLEIKEDSPRATSQITLDGDNPFFKWHKHVFPGVMLIEFTQQLGFVIAKEVLGIKGLPFMFQVRNVLFHLPVEQDDTIIATTSLRERKRHFLFFDSEIRDLNGNLIMNASFCGAGK